MRANIINLVGLFWIVMVAVLLLSDARSAPVEAMSLPANLADAGGEAEAEAITPTQAAIASETVSPVNSPLPADQTAPVDAQTDPTQVAAPYASYSLTQGLHGFSYGHAAVDLTGGKGAAVLAPISGTVTQFFYDELGNPTLMIENEVYLVTLMHGNYTVQVGDVVALGQPVGSESNLGNTVDWRGQSCRGRDCGYHTHLNIFDKRSGSNVNPIELIQ